jgi:uncharacterized protein (TIGR03067 family)
MEALQMKSSWRLLWVVLSIAFLVASDDWKPNHKTELVGLEGKWQVIAICVDGQNMPYTSGGVVFAHGTYTWTEAEPKPYGTYQADVSCHPAHLDKMPNNGPYKGHVYKSIYKIEGNTLVIAGCFDSDERPTSFQQRNIGMYIYERVEE